ncbi:MAG: putative 3-methyladenine DNA glycosylase [Dehalococcoidia bacterium]|nr:MAG: putative 3-methyladenine DNA glycosylase [Dehalococcoidia bacterium]
MRAGKIVEVEAYIGEEDRACHCRSGRTARNAPMYGPGGHAYLYLIYGLSTMLNVVTEPAGRPAAVLIRALEPAEHVLGRTDGPGRLTAALAIPRSLTGHDLLQPPLTIVDRGARPPRIVATERINVDYAGEWAAMPWRFIDVDSPYLSVRPRRS